jgi:hypothetical protein
MTLVEKLIEFRWKLQTGGIEPEALPFPLAIPKSELKAGIERITVEFHDKPSEAVMREGTIRRLLGFEVRAIDD